MSLQALHIKGWLETYAKPSTRRVFLAGVTHFLESVYGEAKDLEQCAAQYVAECRAGQRDWFKDLLKYAAYLNGRPPKSARAYMAGARSFLEYSLDVEITRKQARLLQGRLPKGSRARTSEMELTREVLRKIIAHADVKGRALFLFLLSSGVRIGEALQLKLEDVDLSVDPPLVTVRGEYTKAGDAYTTFISSEAREALEEWLRVRDSYLESAKNRGRGLGRSKAQDDPRLFPFSETVAEQMWATCIEKAQLDSKDPSTGRRRLRIHMLRKWFLSQAKMAVPESVAEAWAGHRGYLDDAYRRYTRQQLAELYRKAEPYLLISAQAQGLQEFVERERQLQQVVNGLVAENMQLRARLEAVAGEVELLRRMVEGLVKGGSP
jgi:integrase